MVDLIRQTHIRLKESGRDLDAENQNSWIGGEGSNGLECEINT